MCKTNFFAQLLWTKSLFSRFEFHSVVKSWSNKLHRKNLLGLLPSPTLISKCIERKWNFKTEWVKVVRICMSWSQFIIFYPCSYRNTSCLSEHSLNSCGKVKLSYFRVFQQFQNEKNWSAVTRYNVLAKNAAYIEVAEKQLPKNGHTWFVYAIMRACLFVCFFFVVLSSFSVIFFLLFVTFHSVPRM